MKGLLSFLRRKRRADLEGGLPQGSGDAQALTTADHIKDPGDAPALTAANHIKASGDALPLTAADHIGKFFAPADRLSPAADSLDGDGGKKTVKAKILGFILRIFQDHVGAYAASAAFFLIMSFIPFVLLVVTLLRYTPLTVEFLQELIAATVPENIQGILMDIIQDLYSRSAAVVPLSALMALWSSGKGLQAITNGLNTIYHVKETRNWLANRIISVGYMVLLLIALIFSLIFMLLGKQIGRALASVSPVLSMVLQLRNVLKWLLYFPTFFVIFLILYRFLPNRRASFRSQIPGALITSFGWAIFSVFFSLYFNLFPNAKSAYGNLTAVLIIMVWLYFLMNTMLYGALINTYFEKELKVATRTVQERIREHRESKKSLRRMSQEESSKKYRFQKR